MNPFMEYKDYYKILGVARDASQDEIKKPIENWPENITLTSVKKPMPKTNLRK
ncbi:hypothetical protein GCM10025856_15940 [Methylophaga marina]|nr:hypothetical protein GCM10025856_15940 [Methylophaga marina]